MGRVTAAETTAPASSGGFTPRPPHMGRATHTPEEVAAHVGWFQPTPSSYGEGDAPACWRPRERPSFNPRPPHMGRATFPRVGPRLPRRVSTHALLIWGGRLPGGRRGHLSA